MTNASIHVEKVDGQQAYYADAKCLQSGRVLGIGDNVGFTRRQAYYKAWTALNKECGHKHKYEV